ncbi:hypothetical protein MMC34_004402 [Xylographa carneopallida]|nr:hypothetical protein [Xylographa carneopallida]
MAQSEEQDRPTAISKPYLVPLPLPKRQLTYFSTGALAGACALSVELGWQRLASSTPQTTISFLRAHGLAVIGRAGVRFWVFDIVKSQLQTTESYSTLPLWTIGAVSGAAGGLAEICAQSIFHRRLPLQATLASQSSRLFLCFGSYTFLSTTFSDETPPSPFWYCWALGAMAGAIGSGIVARVEGVRGRPLWRGAVPKGALAIGTVIAVQVTSCAAVLKTIDN